MSPPPGRFPGVKPNQPAPTWGIHGRSTVLDLAASTILDTLSGSQLAVYLRLLATATHQGKRKIEITNRQLGPARHPSTISRDLFSLERMGLLRLEGAGTMHRRIEIL